MKKSIPVSIFLSLSLAAVLFSSCKPKSVKTDSESDSGTVTVTVAGPWGEFPALETAAAAFTKKYPDCKIEYEYIQNYGQSLITRLKNADSGIDIFVTNNILPGSPLQPYTLELFSQGSRLDLSHTFDGLIQNFTYKETPQSPQQLYAIPMGAELRGMYVNKTLLAKLGISIPQNRSEFLAACEKLLKAGYIPVQGNPSKTGQWLLYPYICGRIVDNKEYHEWYSNINSCKSECSEYFRDAMQFMYLLVEKGYYNYKYVETTYKTFSTTQQDALARYFLNIQSNNSIYTKCDDTGIIAFMPGTMSLGNILAKAKDDYHSLIEYTFILSPVTDRGGYAYMSPADGLAINKKAEHTEQALQFLNFLFTPETNKKFASQQNITPDTADAFDQIKKQFSIPANRILHVGQVTFDYNFFSVISETLIDISKANNPKYMLQNKDGTYTMYPFETYMHRLAERFAKVKK